MLITSYELQPGFASGWFHHLPSYAFVVRGVFSYYEARDGQCVKFDEYSRGQAYFHGHDGEHVHMAVNEGTEPVTLLVVFFNAEHGGATSTLPNTLDAADFTAFPPAGCPRLR